MFENFIIFVYVMSILYWISINIGAEFDIFLLK